MNQIIQKANRKLKKALAPSLVCRVTRKLRVGVFPRYYSCPSADEIYRYLDEKVYSPDLFIESNILKMVDLAHIFWPEKLPGTSGLDFSGPNLDKHKQIIEQLKQNDIGIVWTQHNLVPHRRGDLFTHIYQAWADATDVAIHVSEWGKELVLSHYKFSDECQHYVIPMCHWGGLYKNTQNTLDRSTCEKELGLPPCEIRIGIIGAPRQGKKVNEFIRAFADCSRTDLQLVVYCLNLDDEIPSDPRIFAMPYAYTERSLFNKRLSVMDIIAMPYKFDGQPLLSSGIPSEAIAFGLPCLITDWPYLSEHLGKAGIPFSLNHDQIIECLESLDRDTIDIASKASKELQKKYDPVRVAELNCEALKTLGMSKRRAI